MGGHALAAGDEEGILTFIDTRRNLRSQKIRPILPRFAAHNNAIFDVAWLQGDESIATAAGDACVRVFDVETAGHKALLRGHTGSARCVRPCPAAPHLLFTAARDGNILGFDLRTRTDCLPYKEPFHSPVLKVSGPHNRPVHYSTTQSLGRKRRRVQADSPPTARAGSVTSLVFSPQNHTQLFSAGASDGAVKLWDMRKLRASCGKNNVASAEPDTPIATVIPGGEVRRDDPYKASRPHGIAHIDVDPSGRRLLVSSTDSSIYMYNAGDIQLGYDKVLTGHTQTTFYIRARFSPDGKFVLSGSANSKAYIWDLQSPGVNSALSPILELEGHSGGEASAVDWCKTDMFKVATCADDSTMKVWTLPGDACAASTREREGDELDGRYESDVPVGHARVPTPPRQRPRKLPQRHGMRLRTGNRASEQQDIRTFFEPMSRPSSAGKLTSSDASSASAREGRGVAGAVEGARESSDGESA